MKDFSYLNFLRDYGKFFSVSNMLTKESIKRRLAVGGITYTEFSYMLLQLTIFTISLKIMDALYNLEVLISGAIL